MNSKHIHLLERFFLWGVAAVLLLFLAGLGGFPLLRMAAYDALYPLLGLALLLYVGKRSLWRKGLALSTEIGLSHLILLPAPGMVNGEHPVYELHHVSPSLLHGWQNRSLSYEEVYRNWVRKLPAEFGRLASWQREQNTRIVTTTHEGMLHVWSRYSGIYTFQRLPYVLDPYAKMNIVQWIFASFALTGHARQLKAPKTWLSYELLPKP